MPKRPLYTLQYESFQWLKTWKDSQALLEAEATSQDYPELDEIKEDVERAVALLMGKFPFFGAFIYKFRILYVPANSRAVKTMATDGKNIFINPAFAKSLTDAQTIFVLCHEILHNVMLHFARAAAKGVKHGKWNIAADYEINPMLVDEGLLTAAEVKEKLHGLYKEKYAGLAAEEIYDMMGAEKQPDLPEDLEKKMEDAKKELPQPPGTEEDAPPPPPPEEDEKDDDQGDQGEEEKDSDKGEEGDEEDQGEGDEGEEGEEGEEGDDQGEGDGKGKGGPGKGGSKSGNGGGEGGEAGAPGEDDDEVYEEDEENGIGGMITPEQSVEMQKELGVPVELPSEKDDKNLMEEAIRQQKKLKGDGGQAGSGRGLIQRAIERFSKPQVNWKNELRRIIGKMVGGSEEYLGKRKHLYRDEYLYGDRELDKRLKTAVMTVDTSGSVGDEQLTAVLTEIYDIIKSKKIKKSEIVYFDDGIQGIDVVKNPPKFDLKKATGGGGTSFVEPMEYLAKQFKSGKMELAIFCTDGFANMTNFDQKPKFAKKFVWLIFDNANFKAPFGKVIHISTAPTK